MPKHKPNPRYTVISARLSDEEYRRFIEAIGDMSISEAIRGMINERA